MKPVSLRTLSDNGLLFEINRRVLHPLGLALAFHWDNTDGVGEPQSVVLLKTDDPDGIIFAPQVFKDGEAKLLDFIHRVGGHRMAERGAVLGFIEQEHPGTDAQSN